MTGVVQLTVKFDQSPTCCSRVRPGGLHPDGPAHRALRQGRPRGQHARPLGAALRPRRTHSRLRLLRLQRHQTGEMLNSRLPDCIQRLWHPSPLTITSFTDCIYPHGNHPYATQRPWPLFYISFWPAMHQMSKEFPWASGNAEKLSNSRSFLEAMTDD